MAKRRITRSVRRVQARVAAGEPLSAALAREYLPRAAYDAYLNLPRPLPERDPGHPHVAFVAMIWSGVAVFVLGGMLQPSLAFAGWILLSLGLLGIDLDELRRGVQRNWNTGHVVYFDEQPVAFLVGISFGLVLSLVFLTFGVVGLAQSLGWQ